MVNKRRPSEKKRKLYKNIINSIILYGAPIWTKEVNEYPNIAKKIHVRQRKTSLRVIRAYRTVSQEMALVLAGNPPVELQAAKLEAVYTRKKVAAEGNVRITDRGLAIIRKQEQDRLVKRWRSKVKERANTGKGFNWEILSCLQEWVERSHGELTYYATQIITGHGCFREYTYRIGKTDNNRCRFCEHSIENNIHVLVNCEEWKENRERLTSGFGRKVESLGIMMKGMVADPNKWNAVLEFCKTVMSRKEVVEREEQADARREVLIRETRQMLDDMENGRHAMSSSDTIRYNGSIT